jgi:hypothetical protein
MAPFSLAGGYKIVDVYTASIFTSILKMEAEDSPIITPLDYMVQQHRLHLDCSEKLTPSRNSAAFPCHVLAF